ncbi:hypothetical protein [Photobacterium sanguinicancri]|uniref:hypothetical protein n=1 Tax=Photobacterium sanguinicancri TaxID=875932 RepID=UPI0007868DDA|nr:hypothetical protein [Photobacterium sanguinicancri]KXI22257.1 hypothetical protein AS132_15225 [Photobacterium sanguinicancri]
MNRIINSAKYCALPLVVLLVGCGSELPSEKEAQAAFENSIKENLGDTAQITFDNFDLSECKAVEEKEGSDVKCNVKADAQVKGMIMGVAADESNQIDDNFTFRNIDGTWELV